MTFPHPQMIQRSRGRLEPLQFGVCGLHDAEGHHLLGDGRCFAGTSRHPLLSTRRAPNEKYNVIVKKIYAEHDTSTRQFT